MANLQETSAFPEGVTRIETNEPVQGGEDGVSNRATKQLANRTRWLKDQLAALQANLASGYATLAALAAHVGGGDHDARYLRLTGGTLTGGLRAPNVSVDDNAFIVKPTATTVALNFDALDYLLFDRPSNALTMILQDAGVARFEALGDALPSSISLVTRAKGDARYAQLSGATFTGPATFLTANLLAARLTRQNTVTEGGELAFERASDGAVVWRIDVQGGGDEPQMRFLGPGGGVVAATLSADPDALGTQEELVTRRRGDGRYLRLTGGTATGELRAPILSVDANAFWRINAGSVVLNFDATDYLLYDRATNALTMVLQDAGVGRFEALGPSMPSSISLATREKGDARWAQLPSPSTSAAETVFPLGAQVMVQDVPQIVGTRRAAATVRLHATLVEVYTLAGAGAPLTGVWRAMGMVTGNSGSALFERVA